MTLYEKISVGLQVAFGVIAVATLVVYYRQLRVMSRQLTTMQEASQAQSGLSLVNFLQAPEVRSARQVVRSVLSDKEITEWSAEERTNAALVVANYDVAAALIRGGLAPIGLVTDNWGPSISHCHKILTPYISEQRMRPGGSADYWSNFDWLSDKCKRSEVPQENCSQQVSSSL